MIVSIIRCKPDKGCRRPPAVTSENGRPSTGATAGPTRRITAASVDLLADAVLSAARMLHQVRLPVLDQQPDLALGSGRGAWRDADPRCQFRNVEVARLYDQGGFEGLRCLCPRPQPIAR